MVNGAEYYRQGRALKLKGHFWVNHVLNFQGRSVAGDKEKKVRLGDMVGVTEALVRCAHASVTVYLGLGQR